jgi:hypothetical protein
VTAEHSRDVRFTPPSGRRQRGWSCPLSVPNSEVQIAREAVFYGRNLSMATPGTCRDQRLLAFFPLFGFQFVRHRRLPRCFRLRYGRILQLDLVAQIIQSWLWGSDAGFRLSNGGEVIVLINFDQKVSGTDALKVVHSNDMHLT